MQKLNVKALALSLGIVWGAAVFVMGLINIFCDYGASFVNFLSLVYINYEPTILGSNIGGIWGFVDAGIGGAILAWLYNKLS
jgi:hypothetical protein